MPTPSSHSIEATVGSNVRRSRHSLGLSQPDLGKRLAPLLGDEFSASQIGHLEAGKRSFRASELLALAVALETNVPALMRPSDKGGVVTPGGEKVKGVRLESALGGVAADVDVAARLVQATQTMSADIDESAAKLKYLLAGVHDEALDVVVDAGAYDEPER